MNCLNCGNEIPNDSAFCPECGARIYKQQPAAPAPVPPVAAPNSYVNEPPRQQAPQPAAPAPVSPVAAPNSYVNEPPRQQAPQPAAPAPVPPVAAPNSYVNEPPRQQAPQMVQQTSPQARYPFFVSSFKPNFSSAGSFVSSVKEITGISDPSLNIGDPYEYNVPIVPDCIDAEENEVVVKQYNIAKLRSRIKGMRADGRLMVTNRRVLFRASGTSITGHVLEEQQFNVDEIAGIEIDKNYKFSFLNLIGALSIQNSFIYLAVWIFYSLLKNKRKVPDVSPALLIILGFLFALGGIASALFIYRRHWLKLLCTSLIAPGFGVAWIGIVLEQAYSRSSSDNGKATTIIFCILIAIGLLFYFVEMVVVCMVPNLVIRFKVKGAGAAISIGSQKPLIARIFSQMDGDCSGFTEVLPWEDTVMAMNELGTMIDDLQKQGDYAIKKWTK